MQLGQTEPVGIIDYHCIGIGYIQAGFDYGRADEYIGFAADEFDHRVFEFVFVHLAVRDIDADFRIVYNNANLLGGSFYWPDAVMDKEYLAIAVKLMHDRFAYSCFVGGADPGNNTSSI